MEAQASQFYEAVSPENLEALTLEDAYTDFTLSRQAMNVAAGTLRFYGWTARKFVEWLSRLGVTCPDEVNARHVRAYLAELTNQYLSENYINSHARAIRTLLKFWHDEEYIPKRIKFKMPPPSKERMPCLNENEVKILLNACHNPRDKALVMFMIDSGLRAAEVISLNWGDVDMGSGVVNLQRGKWGKSRSVVIGAKTRRALLAYRRTISPDDTAPLFQTEKGTRFVYMGFRTVFVRLSERAGIKVTAHTLRRTFATLSLRNGMSPLHLQGLLGHSTLEMTRTYVQMVDDDLHKAHHEHGPIDKLF